MFVNWQQLFVLTQLIRFILASKNTVLSLLQYCTTTLFHYILHYCTIALHLTILLHYILNYCTITFHLALLNYFITYCITARLHYILHYNTIALHLELLHYYITYCTIALLHCILRYYTTTQLHYILHYNIFLLHIALPHDCITSCTTIILHYILNYCILTLHLELHPTFLQCAFFIQIGQIKSNLERHPLSFFRCLKCSVNYHVLVMGFKLLTPKKTLKVMSHKNSTLQVWKGLSF